MNIFLNMVICISLFIYNLIQSVFLFLTPKRFRKCKDITGQKVLITGAGSGLGRQLAIEFSRHSTCLILLDINKKAMLETEKLLDPKSCVFIYECDVANSKMVYGVADEIQSQVGDVDILVSNAGVVSGKNLLDIPDEQIRKTIDVNVTAHFWVCKAFLSTMMAKNRGHLVFVCSIAGYLPNPKLTDYCASKYATIGFAECLEMELRSNMLDGIKVTIINPSHINTGLFDGLNEPFTIALHPEYVAKKIVSAVKAEKESVFIPYFFYILALMKAISPRWLMHRFYVNSGHMNGMVNFRGRPDNNNDERSNRCTEELICGQKQKIPDSLKIPED